MAIRPLVPPLRRTLGKRAPVAYGGWYRSTLGGLGPRRGRREGRSMHTHPTKRAPGALAALVLALAILAGGLAMPSGASAASAASWYWFQTDSDRCYDVAQWWNGTR